MFPKSIRWRLQLWYGVLLVIVLGGFGFTAYQLERGRQFRRVDDELERRAGALANTLHQPPRNRFPLDEPFRGAPPDDEPASGTPRPNRGPFNGVAPENFPPPPRDFHLPPQIASLFSDTDSNAIFYIVRTRNGDELSRSINAPENFPDEPSAPEKFRTQGTLRELLLVTPPGESILVGRSIARELSDLHRTALKLSAIGGIILALGLAGGWWLASRAIRPIAEISHAAAKISSGNLSQRINVAETESELGQLASVLNSTFARLDTAFAQQTRFTADAAHELRTPVSVMLTQTQSALARERSAVEYRETIEACQRATQRMRRLIESLLELARLDAGQEAMKKIPFDLADTTRDCIELIALLAAEREIRIVTELASAKAIGDPERLAQVITNLLSNAIHYNKSRGEIRVRTKQENGFVAIEVEDTGDGISSEDLPHIFDRFYRAEKSRSSGRTGLGLSISKAIIEANGGKIEVASELGKGTVFTVRLPDGAKE